MTAAEWDARALAAVGALIRRYVATESPPAASRTAADLVTWADRLEESGRAERRRLGLAHLRPIEGGKH